MGNAPSGGFHRMRREVNDGGPGAWTPGGREAGREQPMGPPPASSIRSHHAHLWQLVVILPLLTIVPVLVMSSLAVSYSRAAIREQVLQPNRSVAQTVAAAI